MEFHKLIGQMISANVDIKALFTRQTSKKMLPRRKVIGGKLHQMHATKGWRKVD